MTPLLPKLTEMEDSTELRLNRNILSVLFETDIVLTTDQVDEMIKNLKGGSRRDKRKVIRDTAYRWHSLFIPFRFSHTDGERAFSERGRISDQLCKNCFAIPFFESTYVVLCI